MRSPVVRRLDANGEPCYGHGASDFVTGSDAVVILCTLAIRLTLGRWFLDTSLGVAWLQEEGQQILGQRPADVAFARSELLRVLWAVEGVDAVESLSVVLDSSTRKATVDVRILTAFGDTRTIHLQDIP